MEGYIVGMTVPYMPDNQQAVIRARIGLFELRALRRDKENEIVAGPFDVRVKEFIDADTRGTAAPRITWITGNEGLIEYKVDKKGNLLAWLPDDPWWHNRVYLMDNPWMNPVNLHTHIGIIAGSDMMEHIAILRRELKQETEICDVYVNGIRRFSAKDREKADIEIDKHRRTFTTIKDGKIELQKERDNTFEIKVRKVLSYKPGISELIQRNRRARLQYGWTSCPEFINEIKPKVIREIEALGLNPVKPGGITSRDIIKGIAAMTSAERKSLADALAGNVPTESGVETGPGLPEDEPPVGERDAGSDLRTPGEPEVSEGEGALGAKLPKKKHAGGRPRKAAVSVED